MRPLKLAGRFLPDGSNRYSYKNDMGVRRPKRSVSIWLILLVSLCGIGGAGYFKIEAGKKTASLASASPSQPDQPANAAPSYVTPAKLRPEAQLELQIENWGQTNSGQKWGVVVQQLSGGGANVNYRAESPFHPAGLEPVLALQTLTTNYAYSTWSQPLAATGLSISDCVTKMIKDSDKDCAKAIGNLAGWKGVNYQLKKAGLTSTDLASYDAAKLHTTAGDVDLYLNNFYKAPDAPAKRFILKLMNRQINRDGIPVGSPGCKVYGKAGDFNGYRNDAAIVVCPKVTYSLVVLSQGGTYDQIADLANLVNKFFID